MVSFLDGLQHRSEAREVLHRADESLPLQDLQVAVGIDRGILECVALLLRGGHYRGLVEIEQVVDEQVRVLCLDAEGFERLARKILLVECHDDAGTAADRSREHMPVSRVRQPQALGDLPGVHDLVVAGVRPQVAQTLASLDLTLTTNGSLLAQLDAYSATMGMIFCSLMIRSSVRCAIHSGDGGR